MNCTGKAEKLSGQDDVIVRFLVPRGKDVEASAALAWLFHSFMYWKKRRRFLEKETTLTKVVFLSWTLRENIDLMKKS